jgi:hypothetical protein
MQWKQFEEQEAIPCNNEELIQLEQCELVTFLVQQLNQI